MIPFLEIGCTLDVNPITRTVRVISSDCTVVLQIKNMPKQMFKVLADDTKCLTIEVEKTSNRQR